MHLSLLAAKRMRAAGVSKSCALRAAHYAARAHADGRPGRRGASRAGLGQRRTLREGALGPSGPGPPPLPPVLTGHVSSLPLVLTGHVSQVRSPLALASASADGRRASCAVAVATGGYRRLQAATGKGNSAPQPLRTGLGARLTSPGERAGCARAGPEPRTPAAALSRFWRSRSYLGLGRPSLLRGARAPSPMRALHPCPTPGQTAPQRASARPGAAHRSPSPARPPSRPCRHPRE